MVADAPTTVFTLNANGTKKTVTIYALGIGNPDGTDAPLLTSIAAFAEQLATYETQVEAGAATEVGIYVPASYVATIVEGGTGSTKEMAWPWKDFGPADFRQPDAANLSPLPYRLVTAAEAEATGVENLEGGASGISVTSGGTSYSLGLRPALPDEITD